MNYVLKSTFYAILFLGALTSISYAGSDGNSSSGGGEVYGDTLNPWFLENTNTVRYCIVIDNQNFNQSSETIASLIESALDSWKTAFNNSQKFATASVDLVPYGQIRLATQNFIREECSPSTQVRFQFGVLSDSQRRNYIPDPTGVIAETIRTSYDKVNLRGQGFIYVAADSGPLRPKGLKIADQPWSFQDGIVLKRILMHEIGHMFGLSHTGSAYELMGQDQPEFIVQKSSIERMSKESPDLLKKSLSKIGIFGFEFPHVQELCTPDSAIDLGPFDQERFFGFSQSQKCHKFVFLDNSVEVYSAPGKGQTYTLVGRASATDPSNYFQAIMRVKISKEQRVFSKLPGDVQATGYILGPQMLTRRVQQSTYESVDGRSSGAIKTTFLPNQLIEMEVIVDGKFVDVFDHGG